MNIINHQNIKYRIQGGLVFDTDFSFSTADLFVYRDLILSEKDYNDLNVPETVLSAKDCYIIPGLTDIHFHGCMGSDCCDGTIAAFRTMASYQASNGVTSIVPATMTVSEEQLEKICTTVGEYSSNTGSDLLGIYMEGPFISYEKKGAQNPAFIRSCDTALLNKLQALSGNHIKAVVVAPETEGALSFIEENADNITISLAHTTADYETAKEAFSKGARQLTHMFNAMPPLSHRSPGPIGAAADDDDCLVELICDGIHIHPSVIRTSFRIFGDDRIIMISDSMRAAGLSDGTYDLGGQRVTVSGKRAVLEDGTIAGSVTNLMDCLRYAVKEAGIPLESAVKCAAINPIRAIGCTDRYGSLEPGKYANMVFLNQDLAVTTVMIHGIEVEIPA